MFNVKICVFYIYYLLNLSLRAKCRKIKLILSDVDGVLTDGGMYYSDKGEMLKKFNTRDGMAIEILQKYRIKTVLITKEKSKIAIKRGIKINVDAVYTGIANKELELKKICKTFHVDPTSIAYIGDDINDLKIMKLVGVSVTPSDGISQIKKFVDYVSKSKGGEGVLREVAEIIIKGKTKNEEK